MGEIADAYIWAEMNGVDLDNNPDAWVEYYHDQECEEYEEELIGLKKKIKKLKRTNKKLKEENAQLKEYERIVASYYMKPIDYETACETVNKLLDDNKRLKQENTKLKELLKRAKEILEDHGDYMIVQEIKQVLGDKLDGTER